MKTKENSFTLPFMLLLIETGFFRSYVKHWVTLIPFFATLLIIPFSRMDALGEAEAGFAQETTEISRLDYLFTQFRVIVTYIRLLFLPSSQNLVYDYPISHSFIEPAVLLSFLFLSSLFVLALYLLFDSKFKSALGRQNSQLMAFGILWFFLTLSIESSVIPIRDVIFEHRVYLPSAGLFLVLTVVALHFTSHFSRHTSRTLFRVLSFSLILITLSVAAYQRNFVWKDDISLWEDVVSKSHGNVRGHNNLGIAYGIQGRWEGALKEFQIVSKLRPNYAMAHYNLGKVYQAIGRLEESAQEYKISLKLEPNDPLAHNNLGLIYLDLKRMEEAVAEFQAALKLRPDYAMAQNHLGNAFAAQGKWTEAVQEYHAALKLYSDYAEAHYNLALVYQRLGRIEEAKIHYQKALQLKPTFDPAQKALEVLSK